MNTIPMKAPKSNSSWSGQPGGGLGPSLRHIQRSNRLERGRYVFSIALFAVTLLGVIGGSVGGVMQDAAARDNFNRNYWANNRVNNGSKTGQANQSNTTTPSTTNQQSRQTQQTTQAPQSPSSQPSSTPAQAQPQPAPAPSAPTTQAKPSAPVSSSPARTVTTPQITPTSSTSALTPQVNTAEEIATMAAARATTSGEPVTYSSQQISTETRNRLLALAVSAATSGSLIFILSLFGVSGGTASVIPKYRLSGNEVLAR